MPLDESHPIVLALAATGKWSVRTGAVGLRAGFHCEYCDCDHLATPDRYKAWQNDHIVPLNCDGATDDPENIALSCRECNVNFKGRWDPRTAAGPYATRRELIAAVREYVKEQRERTSDELANIKFIVGSLVLAVRPGPSHWMQLPCRCVTAPAKRRAGAVPYRHTANHCR